MKQPQQSQQPTRKMQFDYLWPGICFGLAAFSRLIFIVIYWFVEFQWFPSIRNWKRKQNVSTHGRTDGRVDGCVVKFMQEMLSMLFAVVLPYFLLIWALDVVVFFFCNFVKFSFSIGFQVTFFNGQARPYQLLNNIIDFHLFLTVAAASTFAKCATARYA